VVNIVIESRNFFFEGEGITDDNERISIFSLFRNVAKETIIIIMFICPSFLMQQLASTWKNCCAILYWVILLSSVEKCKSCYNQTKITDALLRHTIR